jgi:hypothetical protein
MAPNSGAAVPGTVSGNGRQVSLAASGQGDDDDDGPPVASKAAELAALRKWLGRHPAPARPFACKALTAADVPAGMAADPRVLLKDGPGKAPAGTGPAGSGTRS